MKARHRRTSSSGSTTTFGAGSGPWAWAGAGAGAGAWCSAASAIAATCASCVISWVSCCWVSCWDLAKSVTRPLSDSKSACLTAIPTTKQQQKNNKSPLQLPLLPLTLSLFPWLQGCQFVVSFACIASETQSVSPVKKRGPTLPLYPPASPRVLWNSEVAVR